MVYDANRKTLLDSGSEADYGPRPPVTHQEIERDLIQSILKDPASASFAFTPERKDVIPKSFASPKAVAVWVSQANVIFKNSSGGVTKPLPFCFAWKDGRIIATSYATDSASGRVVLWQHTGNMPDTGSVATSR
jgi:hypothetical protein